MSFLPQSPIKGLLFSTIWAKIKYKDSIFGCLQKIRAKANMQ